MPRDSSGNYTLPAGNPVIAGTVITPTWANPTMGDLGLEMTDSLSRSAKGGMLDPLLIVAGSNNLPALAFVNDSSSGLWYEAAAELRMGVTALNVTRWLSQDYGFEIWNGAGWEKPITIDQNPVQPTGQWEFLAAVGFKVDVIFEGPNISMAALPTVGTGAVGTLWNDVGTVKVVI